jgi:hypothetical protein
MRLYHATRLSNLDAILAQGLLSSHYGAVHGSMEYPPPENAVYLSSLADSSNLNSALFNKCDAETDDVIVLEIDPVHLDAARYFPDDAFFYALDDQYCENTDGLEDDELEEYVSEMLDDFCAQFGVDPKKGRRLLTAFCEADGSPESYAPIAKELAHEYLGAQGEVAYLGDVPAAAIVSWRYHPETPGKRDRPEPAPRRAATP